MTVTTIPLTSCFGPDYCNDAPFPIIRQGYTDADNTWEPLENLEENEKLDVYLKDHPALAAIIDEAETKQTKRRKKAA